MDAKVVQMRIMKMAIVCQMHFVIIWINQIIFNIYNSLLVTVPLLGSYKRRSIFPDTNKRIERTRCNEISRKRIREEIALVVPPLPGSFVRPRTTSRFVCNEMKNGQVCGEGFNELISFKNHGIFFHQKSDFSQGDDSTWFCNRGSCSNKIFHSLGTYQAHNSREHSDRV